MIPWRQAWQEALYGPRGFYRREEGPAGHFTTSTQGILGEAFAAVVAAVADSQGLQRIIDVGAGRGELLTRLHHSRPDLVLTGVDVVQRPASLPGPVGWLHSPGGPGLPDALAGLEGVLLVANEWLDVIPCTIAQVATGGVLREVLVDPASGREALGDEITGEDAAWARRWWPAPEPGRRVEIGRARDGAHADLISRVDSGLVLVVDYGHDRASRPREGSLVAYRKGALVAPVPDGSRDLTAHVAMDTLGADEVTSQREALAELGILSGPPSRDLAARDPAGYLAALSRASAVAALADPMGLGAFRWARTRRH